ncbi:MAG: hypothetical protein ACW98X_18550 [Promethearchaeota archaeon]|jgi:hypothetical protein
MYYYILCTLPLISASLYIITKADVINITYTSVRNKIKVVNTCRKLVGFKFCKQCVRMLASTIYISLIQYFNNSVVKTSKNEYVVTYVVAGRMYKMVVKPDKGPTKILQISNDLSEDVTDMVLPYVGPNYDWHKICYKPEYFKCKSLTFSLSNGDEYSI